MSTWIGKRIAELLLDSPGDLLSPACLVLHLNNDNAFSLCPVDESFRVRYEWDALHSLPVFAVYVGTQRDISFVSSESAFSFAWIRSMNRRPSDVVFAWMGLRASTERPLRAGATGVRVQPNLDRLRSSGLALLQKLPSVLPLHPPPSLTSSGAAQSKNSGSVVRPLLERVLECTSACWRSPLRLWIREESVEPRWKIVVEYFWDQTYQEFMFSATCEGTLLAKFRHPEEVLEFSMTWEGLQMVSPARFLFAFTGHRVDETEELSLSNWFYGDDGVIGRRALDLLIDALPRYRAAQMHEPPLLLEKRRSTSFFGRGTTVA